MGSGGLHIEIEAFFNIIGLKNVEFYLNGKHFTWEMGDFTQIGGSGGLAKLSQYYMHISFVRW